ncbi:hypothetical protein PCH_Pc12g15900 [Penicillium rubens Wisconsin 54-1255]|uniref:Uncharacterized protein n=1 Tax=Penicillium rubens (strain ATCC 28089 / DSM 1075 / NRRL 1951 / Wisconsin 54-1255) TaxID=500485 RepID=B6GYE3_PENRW|nr:hypothetical protein PCH_Pc12g15900 [Penicillium rubens Wisconsin 54-1255]
MSPNSTSGNTRLLPSEAKKERELVWRYACKHSPVVTGSANKCLHTRHGIGPHYMISKDDDTGLNAGLDLRMLTPHSVLWISVSEDRAERRKEPGVRIEELEGKNYTALASTTARTKGMGARI